MHILLIHQAFAALDEPGGTRHHEIADQKIERFFTTSLDGLETGLAGDNFMILFEQEAFEQREEFLVVIDDQDS